MNKISSKLSLLTKIAFKPYSIYNNKKVNCLVNKNIYFKIGFLKVILRKVIF